MKLDFETNTSTVDFVDNSYVNDVNSDNGSAETMQMLRDGIKAAQSGNRAEARQLLLRVTDAEPKNENAWLWLASISEYPEELLIFLNNVLSINSANERALEWAGATKTLLSKTFVQRGIDASKETHTDFAKQCFLQAIVHDTDNEMAWLWLASVCDSVEEKLTHLQKVLSINPENETAFALLQSAKRQLAETQMQKAIAAAVADDHTSAHRLLQDVMRQAPEFEEAWVLKSYLANSFSDKISCFKKILEFNPNNGLAQVSLISLLGMMAKAGVKTENPEQTFDNQEVETEQNDGQMFAVEEVEAAENAADVEMSEDEELENYFAEPTSQAQVLEETQFAEVVQPTEETQFVEEVEQDSVPTQELEFVENSAEESDSETAEVSNDDVPELEFDAAEMNQRIELENLEEDFDEVVEHSSVEMESETNTSADDAENYNDQVNDEPEVLESENSDEVEYQIESAKEHLAETEAELNEEPCVAGYTEQTFFAYSNQAIEVFDKPVSAQPFEEEDFSETVEDSPEHAEVVEVSMADEATSEYVEIEEEMFASNTVAENDYAPTAEETTHHSETNEQFDLVENHQNYPTEVEEAEQYVSADVNTTTEENGFEQNEIEEHQEEKGYQLLGEEQSATNGSKSHVEMLACPFCNAENESNVIVCIWCRAMLSLSDLEMILAHHEVNMEMLANSVAQMEVARNLRDFSSDELKNLGIGQINLKQLRQGFSSLQAASKLNPNDVVLSSQVNALAIRLSEIEQQESIHSTMPKNRTILVVDDSATVRKLVSGKLEKCGHEVICAIDGVDALEKINALVPDLILLDITMPRMDGYQVCKLIRNNEATKDVPVVMISGKDGFFDKVRGRMAGTTGYITKPFGPETLMKTVEAYIV